MNLRYKELESQCYETVPCGLNGTQLTVRFDQKKFAELLVKQCLSLTHFEGRDRSAAGIRERISTHFGVEL